MTRDEIEKEFEKTINKASTPLLPLYSEGQIYDYARRVGVDFAEHILRVAETKRWQPIWTAPKNKIKFDVWVEEQGVRVTDCWWGYPSENGKVVGDPGIVKHFDDGKNYGAQLIKGGTHWMPLPEEPSAKWQSQYHQEPEQKEKTFATANFFVGGKKIFSGPCEIEFDSQEEKLPTEEGKRRYGDGFYEGIPCTCVETCKIACRECGCRACDAAYYDAIDYD